MYSLPSLDPCLSTYNSSLSVPVVALLCGLIELRNVLRNVVMDDASSTLFPRNAVSYDSAHSSLYYR
jgi:hypothetical protein